MYIHALLVPSLVLSIGVGIKLCSFTIHRRKEVIKTLLKKNASVAADKFELENSARIIQ